MYSLKCNYSCIRFHSIRN